MIRLELARTERPVAGDVYIGAAYMSRQGGPPCPAWPIRAAHVALLSHVTRVTMIGLYTRSGWDVPSKTLGS